MSANSNLQKKWSAIFIACVVAVPTVVFAAGDQQISDVDQRVQAIFETTYAEKCRSLVADQNQKPSQPEIYTLWFNYGDENYPERPYRIYEYLCFEGPYNQGFVYYGADQYFEIYPISFAVPTFDIIKADEDDYRSAVTAINVTGFTSTDMITNARFNEKTREISSFAKWTGPAETFSVGHWGFDEGQFVLKTFDVDAEWDGKRIPERIFGDGEPASYD